MTKIPPQSHTQASNPPKELDTILHDFLDEGAAALVQASFFGQKRKIEKIQSKYAAQVQALIEARTDQLVERIEKSLPDERGNTVNAGTHGCNPFCHNEGHDSALTEVREVINKVRSAKK